MSGLSDLKVKIKNQPHNLAWINDKERSVLKAMGGSGKAGPMGIQGIASTASLMIQMLMVRTTLVGTTLQVKILKPMKV